MSAIRTGTTRQHSSGDSASALTLDSLAGILRVLASHRIPDAFRFPGSLHRRPIWIQDELDSERTGF
jgi:hypothetical protein